MGQTYQVYNQEGIYFVTFTVHQWVDVFTRSMYVEILLESIKFCQDNKGLEVYSWVIMSNHCHFILRSNGNKLSDIIRDLKKHTAKKIVKAIEDNELESRKRWMLWLLKKEGHIWFWEEGYHGVEITTEDFFATKLKYIHLNPVRAGLVEKEEDYLLSSCADLYGLRKGPLKLMVL